MHIILQSKILLTKRNSMNYYVVFGAALLPLIIGSIWYNPKVFGSAWMKSAGKTEEDLAGGNMMIIFGLTYILGILLALGLSGMTNHQSGVMQLFAMHPDFGTSGTEIQNLYDSVMDKFGSAHRNFGHGALHGGIAAILIALPLIAITALFERRGGKYIFIHFGYYFLTFMAVGAVVCQFM